MKNIKSIENKDINMFSEEFNTELTPSQGKSAKDKGTQNFKPIKLKVQTLNS